MDAPTEWTYGGKLDWSSADSLRLAPLGMAVRCIIEALKERAEAANYTLPEILTDEWNPFQIPSNIVPAIQLAIDALLAPVELQASSVNFYKHDIEITTYSNDSFPPSWTSDNIFDMLSTPGKINIPERLGVLREWAYQQYEILNLMRQVFGGTHNPYSALTNCIIGQQNWKFGYGYGEDQAAVNEDWECYQYYENNLPRGKGAIWNGIRWDAFAQSATDQIYFYMSKNKQIISVCNQALSFYSPLVI